MMSLSERMKDYEFVSRIRLTPKIPIVIRVDGKCFHKFTQGFNRPFDYDFIASMYNAAREVAENIQGFKVGYIQSDEASFVICDDDSINTQGYFGNNMNKLVSITASMMTYYFNKSIRKSKKEIDDRVAIFDSRAFNIPRNEVANYLLWRAKDWERNSLQMYARNFFSVKELKNKKKTNINEMLFKIDKNWSKDLIDMIKNGTFMRRCELGIRSETDILPNFNSVNEFAEMGFGNAQRESDNDIEVLKKLKII